MAASNFKLHHTNTWARSGNIRSFFNAHFFLLFPFFPRVWIAPPLAKGCVRFSHPLLQRSRPTAGKNI